ncbi:GNAT family N-acetyltransferase [Microbacterium sp. CPCC 204701]|uniref:GNAT family N-acetyltransferase n=1 Tax=Microbacterium sp. CPCC 204701 TaxID=2493084 RepID=UPI000FDBC45A|nr:GNAT family N-acetyltransferase [Microbacterium sp. CPCC 204701]
MPRIRPFRAGDEPALADICLKTADAGADATGVLQDDDLWAEIFVLPYVARHPEFAFVVEADDGRVAGYIVCAPDTVAFEDWFSTQWWPRHTRRWPEPAPATEDGSRQDGILRYAYGRRGGATQPFGDAYPAHLHIDLLPEAQGQGLGRRLIETLEQALRDAGVRGVHLVATAENAGAIAFYPRVGFAPLPSPQGTQAFGKRL